MTKFIKLNEVFQSGGTTPVLLNVACIKSIKLSDKGRDTHIFMTDQKYYFVKETVDEIYLMVITDNTKHPVIMNANEALEYYKMKDGC